MLNDDELQSLAEMIPAKATYAVLASWRDIEESADDWNDWEHIQFFDDWAQACDAKRRIEADGLAAYIIEPEGVTDDLEA
jgi:hypothetical protein